MTKKNFPTETLYIGDCDEDERPHGWGVLYALGTYFSGTFCHGRMNGRFLIRDGRNEGTIEAVIEDGEIVGEELHGTFTDVKITTRDAVYTGGMTDDFSPDGPFTCTYTSGAVMKGTYVNGRVNGLLSLEYPDGQILLGYMLEDEPDLVLSEKCVIRDRKCPDEETEYFWEAFMEKIDAQQSDFLFAVSRLDILLYRLFRKLIEEEAGYGLLRFSKDGIYTAVTWEQPAKWIFFAEWPYFIADEEELRYFRDLWYDRFHLRFVYMNDSEQADFAWVRKYEIFERMCDIS